MQQIGPRLSLGPQTIPPPVRRALTRLGRALFAVDDAKLSRSAAAFVFALRLGWLVVRGFFRERLQMRAAALSFATVLAFVPAAAIAFCIADALGATELLLSETVEPFLEETLGDPADPSLPSGVRNLRATLDGLLLLVRSTHVAGLGATGLFVVAFSIHRVLRGVEEAFHHIFRHRGPRRSVARRLRAFALVAATTPLGLGYAIASAVLSHGEHAHAWLERAIPYGPARDALLLALPPLVTALALYLLYVELPDAEIRRRSAALAASIAAVAWYGVQLLHIRFQVGLARYNALYSGFGAFPTLLLSIHVSWVVVLLGAQVLAAHQNAPSLRQLAHGSPRSLAERQAVALRAAVALARAPSGILLRALAAQLGVGVAALRDVLDDLASHGLVHATVERRDRRYVLAVEPAALAAATILDALEHAPGEPDLPWDADDEPIRTLIVARRAAASSSGADRTIAELAADEPERHAQAASTDGVRIEASNSASGHDALGARRAPRREA